MQSGQSIYASSFEYDKWFQINKVQMQNDGLVSDEVSSEDELEQKADGLFIINRDNLPIRAWYYHAHDLSKNDD